MAMLYKAKSINGAQQRVRHLEKQIDVLDSMVARLQGEGVMLAKLAATGAAFTNPFRVWEAQQLRDKILASIGLRPDGTPQ